MSYTELNSKNVKGRNEYKCSWCGESILKGELHRSRSGVLYKEFKSNREHLECAEAMNKIDWNDWDNLYEPYQYKRGSDEQR